VEDGSLKGMGAFWQKQSWEGNKWMTSFLKGEEVAWTTRQGGFQMNDYGEVPLVLWIFFMKDYKTMIDQGNRSH
jgi:hypothetical protein